MFHHGVLPSCEYHLKKNLRFSSFTGKSHKYKVLFWLLNVPLSYALLQENVNLVPPSPLKIQVIAGVYLACMASAVGLVFVGVDSLSRLVEIFTFHISKLIYLLIQWQTIRLTCLSLWECKIFESFLPILCIGHVYSSVCIFI